MKTFLGWLEADAGSGRKPHMADPVVSASRTAHSAIPGFMDTGLIAYWPTLGDVSVDTRIRRAGVLLFPPGASGADLDTLTA